MASSPDNPDSGAAQNRSYPQQPGAPADGGVPPTSGNPYNYGYGARQEPPAGSQPDLDANAPVLKASEMRRLNRRALGFLAALVVVIGLAAMWMFNSVISRGNNKPKPREEVVSVPEVPHLPPLAQAQPPAKAQPIAVAPATPPALPKPHADVPHGPTLLERRLMDSNVPPAVGVNAADQAMLLQQQQMAGMPGGIPGMPDLGASAADGANGPPEYRMPSNRAYKPQTLDKTASAQPLGHPDTVMTRGTYIRCVLETHVVTDVPGFTSCIVTEPVYSFTGKRLLLPKGSKVLGQYGQESDTDRVAVIWDRIITPNGIDVNMASPGIDDLGGAGHPGYVDNHWGERIGAALLISILSDAFSYEAAIHGPNTTTVTSNMAVETPWQSNTAQTLQNLANQAVRRAANRPPTIVINQGTVVYVYVAKDIDFSGVVARS